MKKSITKNKKMTIEELFRLFIYRPYCDVIHIMVTEDERIHIKGDTWIVTLDHSTGDFSFSGELHRYYEIDTITSIRDCFGDIYSVFNFNYSSIPRNTWITINDEDFIHMYDEEVKKMRMERKKKYYIEHKEDIKKYQKEYYKRRKQIT